MGRLLSNSNHVKKTFKKLLKVLECMMPRMRKLMLDCSLLSDTLTNVSLNSEKMRCPSIEKYAQMCGLSEYIVLEHEAGGIHSRVLIADNTNLNSEDNMSFVNGLETPNGGTHHDEWTISILKSIVTAVNKIHSKSSKSIKKITRTRLRGYLFFIIICRIPDPSFAGEVKGRLTDPKPPTRQISENEMKKILKWPFFFSTYRTTSIRKCSKSYTCCKI